VNIMNNKAIQLSAIVIAKNEESRIAKCLESLIFCDEIIVVDNGSTDRTAPIAKKYSAHIENFQASDFSALRNFGKSKAKGIWILYIDADEVVTPELKEEIIKTLRIADNELIRKNNSQFIIRNQTINGYYISRRNYYFGQEWSVQDKMQRLFLKDALVRWEGILHETAVIEGKMGILKEPLIHNTHRTLEEMVAKTNDWSQFEAQLRFNTNHPKIAPWRFIRVMMTGFFRSFIKEGGWRMGTVGWIESVYQAFSMFITYAKLWELQNSKEYGMRNKEL
jgi:glycosyltransferase involved in cell wall biosynthesis